MKNSYFLLLLISNILVASNNNHVSNPDSLMTWKEYLYDTYAERQPANNPQSTMGLTSENNGTTLRVAKVHLLWHRKNR